MEETPEIGIITGNFDVIHPGYIKLFKQLTKACVTPYVLLHGDPSIERPEKLKPILSIDERIEMIQTCFDFDLVHFLIYNTEAELLILLKALRPDMQVTLTYSTQDTSIHLKLLHNIVKGSLYCYKKTLHYIENQNINLLSPYMKDIRL